MPAKKKAQQKQMTKSKLSSAAETRPGKKLTLERLQRLEAGQMNQMHNRFVVDPQNKVAWVPQWVQELRVAGAKPKVVKTRKSK